jgi:hypothetical protein
VRVFVCLPILTHWLFVYEICVRDKGVGVERVEVQVREDSEHRRLSQLWLSAAAVSTVIALPVIATRFISQFFEPFEMRENNLSGSGLVRYTPQR